MNRLCIFIIASLMLSGCTTILSKQQLTVVGQQKTAYAKCAFAGYMDVNLSNQAQRDLVSTIQGRESDPYTFSIEAAKFDRTYTPSYSDCQRLSNAYIAHLNGKQSNYINWQNAEISSISQCPSQHTQLVIVIVLW